MKKKIVIVALLAALAAFPLAAQTTFSEYEDAFPGLRRRRRRRSAAERGDRPELVGRLHRQLPALRRRPDSGCGYGALGVLRERRHDARGHRSRGEYLRAQGLRRSDPGDRNRGADRRLYPPLRRRRQGRLSPGGVQGPAAVGCHRRLPDVRRRRALRPPQGRRGDAQAGHRRRLHLPQGQRDDGATCVSDPYNVGGQHHRGRIRPRPSIGRPASSTSRLRSARASSS